MRSSSLEAKKPTKSVLNPVIVSMAKFLKAQYKEAKKELSLRKSQDMELFTVNEIMDLDIK